MLILQNNTNDGYEWQMHISWLVGANSKDIGMWFSNHFGKALGDENLIPVRNQLTGYLLVMKPEPEHPFLLPYFKRYRQLGLKTTRNPIFISEFWSN